MIGTILATINSELNKIGVPYEFMMWTSPVEDRYWVGEFSETPTDTEDGCEEMTGLLTGTTSGTWESLLQDITKIKDHFPSVGGLRVSTPRGTVVIFYDNSFPVPTGEANLKRIQVNLNIKSWKGMS